MNYQLDEDQFLKELLQDLPKEKAPDGFTIGVMDTIEKEESSAFLTENGLPKLKYILGGLGIILGLSFIIYFLDFSWLNMLGLSFKMDAKSSLQNVEMISSASRQVINAFSGIGSKFGIAAGIIALFVLERFLKYRGTRRREFVLF